MTLVAGGGSEYIVIWFMNNLVIFLYQIILRYLVNASLETHARIKYAQI